MMGLDLSQGLSVSLMKFPLYFIALLETCILAEILLCIYNCVFGQLNLIGHLNSPEHISNS